VRFTENGPSIPDELLFAQDEGRVVFFCGSGVSKARVNLPDFTGLTKKVLKTLRASTDSGAVRLFSLSQVLEAEHGVRGFSSADRIFALLTREFPTEEINRAVAQALHPGAAPDLSAHKTMLRLARVQDRKHRLITTNFDLLFEACNRSLKCATRSNLPRLQFADGGWGLIHLHGSVKPDYSGPTEDGFVLSSAEFGDAYLAQGWARDFVRDVLDRYVAVFVGYSADDPPLRYLLEGQSWPGESAQRAKWIFCLTAASMLAANQE
jgi:SIR2-like domain